MKLNYCQPLLVSASDAEIQIMDAHKDQAGSGAFTYAELRLSFNWVTALAGMENWKDRIHFIASNNKIKADNLTEDLIAAAISYFTGSDAKIYHDTHDQIRVSADGYFVAVGA